MELKSLSKEEISNMSYDDIAYLILKETGKKIKITDLFKKVCDELNLSEKEYENKIGDFFSLLATEKRFIQLEKGFWDLRENHTSEISISDIQEELEDEEELNDLQEKEDEILDEEDKDYYDELDETDDENEDDLKDLVIVDENYDEELSM